MVFAERGFHPTSMNDIALSAGVTKPVLYQHFRSKRELYIELLEDVGAQLQEAITKATTEADTPRDQVIEGFRAYFRFADQQRTAFQMLFGGGTRRDEEFAEMVRHVESSLADIIAQLIGIEGLTYQERRLLAHGIVGLAEGASRHWLQEGATGNSEALAARLAELAWAGLRGVRPA